MTRWLLPLSLAFLGACASLGDAESGADASCVGPACAPVDAGRDQVTADVAVFEGGVDSGGPALNALCGTGCVPDDPGQCAGFAGAGGGGPEPDTDAGASDGGAPEASPPATDAGTAAPDGGISEAGPAQAYGCFVTKSAKGAPVAECAPAGTGATGAPCLSVGDCAPGFACVGEGAAGQCRPYCCGGPAACEKGSYCAEVPVRTTATTGSDKQMVPVCVQADDCNLGDPYPCPPTKQCKCKDGTACAVVRDDGTTSCVAPGKGSAGDPCPCAPGHVCSLALKTCLKLCQTESSTTECGSGKCQSVAYLPKGFGVCALTNPDGG